MFIEIGSQKLIHGENHWDNWTWRLVSKNGTIQAWGNGYDSRKYMEKFLDRMFGGKYKIQVLTPLPKYGKK